MHLYIAVRGQKKISDRFIDDLRDVNLPYVYAVNQNGQKQAGYIQLGVRPISVYELSYPEECNEYIMKKLICPQKSSWNPKYNKYFSIIRKLLGLDELKEDNNRMDSILETRRMDLDVYGLGTKKDRKNADGIEQI